MKKAIQHIYNFFLKPEQDSFSEQSITDKIKFLLFLLIFEMPFMFAAVFLQQLLFRNGLVNSENHFVNEFFKERDFLSSLILILILPFIEELVFRLPLRYKKINFIPFIIFITLLTWVLLSETFYFSLALSIPLFVVITTFLILYTFNRRMADKRETFLSSKYNFYFYTVAILFALSHLSNFSYSVSLLLFAPIVLLPQFIGGFFMGFIRIKQGFIWGFFLHALHNAIFILPVLLFPSINNPKLIEKIERDDYTFEVYEGHNYKRLDAIKSSPIASLSKVTPNEIILSGTFKDVVSILTFTNKRNIGFKNSILAEKEISVYFRNDSVNIESARIASFLVFENLLKSYNLESKTEKRDLTVWNLSVKDEQLFAKSYNDSVDITMQNTIRSFHGPKDTLKLEKINSVYLAKALQIAFNIEVQNDINKNLVFSIKIPNCEFSELKWFLEQNYGLTIEKKTEKRDVLVIF